MCSLIEKHGLKSMSRPRGKPRMRETREIAMEETVPRRQSFRNNPLSVLRTVGMSMLFSMLFAGVAAAQTIAVTGTVTSQAGAPLTGVTVRVSGTETRVLTNGTGQRSAELHGHRPEAGA